MISKKDISLVQMAGKNYSTLKISNIKNENGIISFNHRFKHRGSYDVHLKIKNDIVASYSFKVTKMKHLN